MMIIVFTSLESVAVHDSSTAVFFTREGGMCMHSSPLGGKRI